MDLNKLAPGKVAQYYALLAWNGMKAEDALKLVEETSFEDLNATTYAGDSVEAAKRGIEKYLLKGNKEIDRGYITGEKNFSDEEAWQLGVEVLNNFKSEEKMLDAIMHILEEIHDKWVVDNAKKYDRDAANNDKRLYQHLPTALIGVDEVAKDLMFLAPILEKMGLPVGKMTENEWGAFVPSQSIVAGYNIYVNNYLTKNDIQTKEDLVDHIAKLNETYAALKVENAPAGKEEFAKKRIEYMTDPARVEKLTAQAEAKNNECLDLPLEDELDK